jgi:hypothetical protein
MGCQIALIATLLLAVTSALFVSQGHLSVFLFNQFRTLLLFYRGYPPKTIAFSSFT